MYADKNKEKTHETKQNTSNFNSSGIDYAPGFMRAAAKMLAGK
jgi:hypothetical protein